MLEDPAAVEEDVADEDEVVPAYYERDEKQLPSRWLERMRKSISSTIWQFSTTRMLHEYAERLYLPAAGIEVGAEAEDAVEAPRG